jgi:hypothetical protein
MIDIIGTVLYQWDTGRSVKVTDSSATHVHFANVGDSQAVIMELAESQALIPDYLLQTGKQLCVYAVANGVTIEHKVFVVKKRERPESYVYDEDYRNFIYALIQSAEEAIAKAEKVAEDLLDSKMSSATLGEVTLLSSAWQGTESPYSQVVEIDGVTENSQVDLTPSIEQLAIFHHKDLAFVTENVDGVVTVYALGDKPTNDYTIQVTITEVYV